MGLTDVTTEGVLSAIAEFDALGRDRFLAQYGFGPAREYFLEHDGKRYDSKAIVGVAHRFSVPDGRALVPDDFSGGEKRVVPVLDRLGFQVVHEGPRLDEEARGRNPRWSEEELILALDLYLREGLLDDGHPKVVELSRDLNALPIHSDRRDPMRFRNPNGVALKLANFAALDPSYPGRGMSRGGRLDAVIWDRFSGDEDALREAVRALNAGRAVDATTGPGAGPGAAVRMPVEAQNAEQFTVDRPATSAEVVRREQRLVRSYDEYLRNLGHSTCRHGYPIDGGSLYSDLFDETTQVLYEAKGDVGRSAVRMAVGQLLDYRYHCKPSPAGLAILLPRRPSPDIVAFLNSLSIQVVFPDGDGGFSNLPEV